MPHRFHRILRSFFWLYLLLLSGAARGTAQEVKNSTGDFLRFTPTGAWQSVTIGGRPLPVAPNVPLLWICDVERGEQYVPLTGTVQSEKGSLQMTLASSELSLQANLTVEADQTAFRYRLQIHDTTGHDRGLLVRMGVPVDAIGWQWWHDIQVADTIEAGKLYEDVQPLRAFAALPEWKDKPALRMGFNTLNFCSVITAPVTTDQPRATNPTGLCFAVPLDQPRIFRTGYDAAQKLLGITYDVALCRETNMPYSADFEFEMFGCNARWGMRDALDKYYQRHPGYFEKVVRDEGMWIAFNKLNEIDNANEFRIGFQEGAGSVAYDDKIDVDSLSYYTHAGMYADVPDHKRGIDPTPSLERRIAAAEAAFKRETKRDGVYAEVGTHDATGKLAAEPGTVYGDVLAQFCLEPELFYGKWLIDRIDPFFEEYRKRGGELDGLYYDGLTQGINYRREHFAIAEYPPAWDPIAKKPYLFNYFSSVEWARHIAQKLHGMGKITMMNGAMAANPFCAPYLDVMGAETDLKISRADFNFVKTITRHKPFVTLMKGNYARIGPAEIELFMKRCLAYGVFPGYFDWPPSGLGPGGTYWDHAEYYERDRHLFRKYLPLVQTIAKAGWEPLTLARATNPDIQVERFGTSVQGHVYFTVLNDSNEPRRETINLDIAALKISPLFIVLDEVRQRSLEVKRSAGIAKVSINLPPQRVALLHVATRPQVIAQHLVAVQQIRSLGIQQRRADADRPARPMFWKADEGRVFHDNNALLLHNIDDTQSTSVNQWVMLFQNTAQPIIVRARLRTEGITAGKSDAFSLHAVICYVDNQFTTRDPRTLQLETDSAGWRTIEWKIDPTRPVRSVQLFLRLNRLRGKAWFDDVSVRSADKPDIEAVADGAFARWYEKLTPAQESLLTPVFNEVDKSLSALPSPLPDNSVPPLTIALKSVQAALQAISKSRLDNAARREQRDLVEIADHLNLCARLQSNVRGLILQAPLRATAGDIIEVALALDAGSYSFPRTDYSLRSVASKVMPVSPNTAAQLTRHYRVAIPANARAGSTITLEAQANIWLDADTALPLRETLTLPIVAANEIYVTADGVDLNSVQTINVRLVNNRTEAQSFAIETKLPTGWEMTTPNLTKHVPPRTTSDVRLILTPQARIAAGRQTAIVKVQGDGNPISVPVEINHIPAHANLLKNGGAESVEGTLADSWGQWQKGYRVDTQFKHSGQHSLRVEIGDSQQPAGASQNIVLNQKTAAPLVIRGWSRAENVSSELDNGYALYIDVYFVDGTKLYGQGIPFKPGSHDWQFGETTIEVASPIASISVYPMLRGKTGTVWFDDLFIAPDASRAGNIARTARVGTDSSYAGYTATPLTDGVTLQTDKLHWTAAAWASADTPVPHWVELQWDTPQRIGRATIFWSLDGGIARTSRRIEVQIPDGNNWKTVQVLTPDATTAQCEITFATFTTQKLRFVQAAGAGSTERPHLMWIREIEVF